MSIITRCPSCFTSFRVTPDQLDIADGMVRCGACMHVFQGREHMLELEETAHDNDEIVLDDLDDDGDERLSEMPVIKPAARMLSVNQSRVGAMVSQADPDRLAPEQPESSEPQDMEQQVAEHQGVDQHEAAPGDDEVAEEDILDGIRLDGLAFDDVDLDEIDLDDLTLVDDELAELEAPGDSIEVVFEESLAEEPGVDEPDSEEADIEESDIEPQLNAETTTAGLDSEGDLEASDALSGSGEAIDHLETDTPEPGHLDRLPTDTSDENVADPMDELPPVDVLAAGIESADPEVTDIPADSTTGEFGLEPGSVPESTSAEEFGDEFVEDLSGDEFAGHDELEETEVDPVDEMAWAPAASQDSEEDSKALDVDPEHPVPDVVDDGDEAGERERQEAYLAWAAKREVETNDSSVVELDQDSVPLDARHADTGEALLDEPDAVLDDAESTSAQPGGSSLTDDDSTDGDSTVAEEPGKPLDTIPDSADELVAELEAVDLKRASRIQFAWGVLSVLLIGGMALQYAWYTRSVYTQVLDYRGYYVEVCRWLQCELPDYRNMTALEATNLVVRSHPEVGNALAVDALLRNRDPFPQRFPDIVLRFFDTEGEPVASRRFSATEYLSGEMRGLRYIPASTEVRISLELIDPGRTALGYQVEVVAARG